MNPHGCSCTGPGVLCQRTCTGTYICTCPALYDANLFGTCDFASPRCNTANSQCGCVAVFQPAYVNPEFSETKQVNDKNKTVEDGSASISKFITFDNTDIFTTPTAEDLQNYFKSLEQSKLTKTQQRLLLDQITADFIETNVLNLYPNVRNFVSRINKPIDKKEIHKQIDETVKTVVENIVLKSDYKEPFLQFNYSQSFQALFYHVSLKLYRFKWDIIKRVCSNSK